jgi:intein-encoded DNA endonuclease-like protein
LDMAQETKTAHFLVLNRVPHASKVSSSLRDSLYENNLPLADIALGNRNSYVSAFLQGSGVTEFDPRSTAAFEVKRLTAELLKAIKNTQKEFVIKTFA